jgi:hypothetical protein
MGKSTSGAKKTEKAQMITSKRVEGEVQHNDGMYVSKFRPSESKEFEEDLLLRTIQIQRCDTENTPEEFQRRFADGMRLSIVTTTEITVPGFET